MATVTYPDGRTVEIEDNDVALAEYYRGEGASISTDQPVEAPVEGAVETPVQPDTPVSVVDPAPPAPAPAPAPQPEVADEQAPRRR